MSENANPIEPLGELLWTMMRGDRRIYAFLHDLGVNGIQLVIVPTDEAPTTSRFLTRALALQQAEGEQADLAARGWELVI